MSPERADPDEEDSGADSGDALEFEADDDESVEIPCPYCRKPIWEEALSCEHCGRYLSKEDPPWRRPAWLVAGVVLGLACVIVWLLSR